MPLLFLFILLGRALPYFLLKLHPTCPVPFKRLFQKAFTELSCYPSSLNSRCTLHDQINLVVLYFCTCPYFSYQITESQIIKWGGCVCVCVYKCVCFFLSPDKEMDPERESGLPKVMWPASGSARYGLHTSRISLGLFLSYLHLDFPKSRLRIHSFFVYSLNIEIIESNRCCPGPWE